MLIDIAERENSDFKLLSISYIEKSPFCFLYIYWEELLLFFVSSFIFLLRDLLIFRPLFNIFPIFIGKILIFFLINHLFFLWEIFFPSLFFRGKILFYFLLFLFLYCEIFFFLFYSLSQKLFYFKHTVNLSPHFILDFILNRFCLMKMEESHLLCPGFSSLLLCCEGTFSCLGWPFLTWESCLLLSRSTFDEL